MSASRELGEHGTWRSVKNTNCNNVGLFELWLSEQELHLFIQAVTTVKTNKQTKLYLCNSFLFDFFSIVAECDISHSGTAGIQDEAL